MMRPVSRTRKRDDDSSCASSAIDSMRPSAPARKRRRTILDAFQSISLFKGGESGGEDDDDDADSSQAVADRGAGEDAYSTSSSLEDDEDNTLMSDREEAQRKVMLQLVFGPGSEAVASPAHSVDVKIQHLIRESLQQATAADYATSDDMVLDPLYTRSSSRSQASSTMEDQPSLPRSNSLPTFSSESLQSSPDGMES